MSAESSGKQHFLVLDGMRGIAALLVVWFHARVIILGLEGWGHAYLAVDFFFCLSGFVIAYAYETRLTEDMTFSDFVKLRLIRLYPMILFSCLLGGMVMVSGGGNTIVASSGFTIAALLILPAGLLFGKQAYPANNPVWSLFFEIAANLFFALLPKLSLRQWLVIALVLGVAYAATAFLFGDMQNVGFASWASFGAGFLRVGFPFAAGVMIFKLGLHRNPQLPFILPLIGLVIVLLLPSVNRTVEDVVIGVVCLPALVALGARSVPRFGADPALRWLGEVSYPLYLIHLPIIRVLRHFPLDKRFGVVGSFVMPVASFVISVVVAMALSRFFDKPVRQWLAKYRGISAAKMSATAGR